MVTREAIEQAVGEAVLHYAKNKKALAPDTRFKDAGFDSLSIIEVVMMVEDILGIDLDEDVYGDWTMATTIQQAVDAVAAEVIAF